MNETPHDPSLPGKREAESALRLAEVERLQFSCDLHDGVLQELIGARYSIEAMRHQCVALATDKLASEKLASQLRKVETRLEEAIHAGRHWIRRLRGLSEEADLPLSEMVEHFLTTIRSEWPKHSIIADIDPAVTALNLAHDHKYALLRIAHEAIRNAAKHSGHSQILFSLSQAAADSPLTLEVIDQGRGFDPQQLPADHYGILGMRLRAELMRAELTIRSTPQSGTIVRLETPVH